MSVMTASGGGRAALDGASTNESPRVVARHHNADQGETKPQGEKSGLGRFSARESENPARRGRRVLRYLANPAPRIVRREACLGDAEVILQLSVAACVKKEHTAGPETF
jgi:hypothetical protein